MHATPAARPSGPRTGSRARPVRLEPLVGLEWSQAIEVAGGGPPATNHPRDTRRAWIHRAPEDQVLSLFRRVLDAGLSVEAPWWLWALADGRLDSRDTGFAIEDAVASVLSRPGWIYTCWSVDGHWEFVPSDTGAVTPTTVLLTDRHPGWVTVVPAHSGTAPAPIAVADIAELAAVIADYELG